MGYQIVLKQFYLPLVASLATQEPIQMYCETHAIHVFAQKHAGGTQRRPHRQINQHISHTGRAAAGWCVWWVGLDSKPTLINHSPLRTCGYCRCSSPTRIASHSDHGRALRSRLQILQPLGSYPIRITDHTDHRPHGSQPTRITATRSLGSIGNPLGLQHIPITAYSDCSPLGLQPLGLQPTRIAATRGVIAHSDHSPLGAQPT